MNEHTIILTDEQLKVLNTIFMESTVPYKYVSALIETINKQLKK